MNLNNLIQRVASKFSDKMDGDTLMSIESFLPDALKTVCRFVAENRPKGHERLLLTQSVYYGDFDTSLDFPRIDLSSFEFPFVVTPKFQLVTLTKNDSTVSRIHNVNSVNGLRINSNHVVPYYCVEEPYLYLGRTYSGSDSATLLYTVDVTHYIFATIDQFPEELADFLVAQIIQFMAGEDKKQAVESQNV